MLQHVLERVDRPGHEEFLKISKGQRQPVLVTGSMSAWPAIGRWDLDYVSAKCGERSFSIERYPDGDLCGENDFVSMTLSEYVTAIRSGGASRYYLAEQGVDEAFDVISHEVGLPAFLDVPPVTSRLRNKMIFAGRDTVSGMHYHERYQAVLCQLHGRKRVMFYAPWQTRDVRPRSWYAARSSYSGIQGIKADGMLEGLCEQARSKPLLDVTLSPGDVLFIPIHWWHLVGGEQESVSMTIFWQAHLREWSFPTPAVRVVGRWITRSGFRCGIRAANRVGLLPAAFRMAEKAGLIDNAQVTEKFWSAKLAA